MEEMIGVPGEYFLKMARHDYQDWRMALPREFYQNSIDAGASKIEVSIDQESRIIVVEDNGCGMTEEVLRNKLLVLGGSHKDNPNSVGSFGKAKELLYFSWEKYEILTQRHRVQGAGARYTLSAAPRTYKGTISQIWVPENESLSHIRTAFKEVATKMQTRARIWVDGDEYKCGDRRGTLVRQIEGLGSLYRVASRTEFWMPVRVQGIWMFSLYVGGDVGALILELARSSLDVLTSNRDGFKWEASRRVENLVKEFHVNPISVLDSSSETEELLFKGTGPVRVAGPKEILKAAALVSGGAKVQDAARQIVREIEGPSPLMLDRLGFLIREARRASEIEIEGVLQLLGSRPDFVSLIPEGGDEIVASWVKKHAARSAVLTKLWTETVRQVLLDNKVWIDFTPGFTFKSEQEASYREGSNGVPQFLLNPTTIQALSPRDNLVDELRVRACHEVSHHLETLSHNERFVVRFHEVLRATWASRALYAKIAKL